MAPRLNWLIYGAGAIGTYIGASLILHGQNVVFLEQVEAAEYLQENGLRFNFNGQEHRILHPDVYSSLPEVLALGIFDVVIFALKSFDTQAALESLRSYSASLPPFLCLQNGVENEDALEQVLGKDKVIAATVTSTVMRRGLGDIVLERSRGIGVAAGHRLSRIIAKALSEAGLNAHLYKNAPTMKWSKMLTNLLANASCAILDMTPAEVLQDTTLYGIEVAQIREALAVMQALQIHPTSLPGTPVIAFAWAVHRLPDTLSRPIIARVAGQGRGQKMPSFYIDLHSGRGKSEVDFLNGAVVRFGDRLNVATPVNRWLDQTLLSLVSGDVAIEKYAHQPGLYLNDLSAATRSG